MKYVWQHGKAPEEKEQTTNQIDPPTTTPLSPPPYSPRPATRLWIVNAESKWCHPAKTVGNRNETVFTVRNHWIFAWQLLNWKKIQYFFSFGCCYRAVEAECRRAATAAAVAAAAAASNGLAADAAGVNRRRTRGRWTRCRVEFAVRS